MKFVSAMKMEMQNVYCFLIANLFKVMSACTIKDVPRADII